MGGSGIDGMVVLDVLDVAVVVGGWISSELATESATDGATTGDARGVGREDRRNGDRFLAGVRELGMGVGGEGDREGDVEGLETGDDSQVRR